MTLRRPWQYVALAAAIGCGGAGEQAARGGGTLRIPLINDPILNPIVAPDIGSVLVNKVLFPGLVRPDEQLRPVPDLATSWTSADEAAPGRSSCGPG